MSRSTRIEELSQDVSELKKLAELATRSKVKDILIIETRKIETEIIKLRELEASSKKEDSSPVSSNIQRNSNRCYEVKLTNYAWDQSDKFIKIYVDLSGVQDLPSEKVTCDFSSREMTLSIKELNNRSYTLSIKSLLFPTDPTSSYHKVKKDKVVIFIHKSQENKHWGSLTGSEKDAKKAPDLDPNVDPSEGLMSMMKKLYEEGDDDMKRTIAKAWTEGQDKKSVV